MTIYVVSPCDLTVNKTRTVYYGFSSHDASTIPGLIFTYILSFFLILYIYIYIYLNTKLMYIANILVLGTPLNNTAPERCGMNKPSEVLSPSVQS